MYNLSTINSSPKNPDEKFMFNNEQIDFSILDFWIWNQSDLIENRNRGILAEFIVRQALGIKCPTRIEWNEYDLEREDGIKIEVKSAAYVQSWDQKRYSNITFSMGKSGEVMEDNNFSLDKKRHADIYVFCLLHYQGPEIPNPMNLDQWTFYLVTTKLLDEKYPNQSTIRLDLLRSIAQKISTYMELSSDFDSLANKIEIRL